MLKNLLIFTAIFLPALALADVEPAVRNSELYGVLTLIWVVLWRFPVLMLRQSCLLSSPKT